MDAVCLSNHRSSATLVLQYIVHRQMEVNGDKDKDNELGTKPRPGQGER